MTARIVEIVIERLVFDGQPPVAAAAVEAAVGRELARLLGASGEAGARPGGAADAGSLAPLPGGPAGAGEIGAEVARAVHRGMGAAGLASPVRRPAVAVEGGVDQRDSPGAGERGAQR